jgi:lipopolysaccharide transport system permease protein
MSISRVVIRAGKTDREYFRDLWRYRELFYVLAWRDISVRYKQTVVGIAWALVRPALSALVFTVVFGKLGKFPSGGLPYPLLVLSGMLPWQLFSSSLSESGNSLISNSGLITKVYFPRLIIPGSSLVTSLVDFTISLAMLAVVMIAYGIAPTWRVVFLPFFVTLAICTAAGFGIWIAALNVRYRDFAFLVPFVVQLGLYVSPVGFSTHVIPEQWRLIYSLNPMVGIIDGFRWALLPGARGFEGASLLVSMLCIAVVLISGTAYFRRTERSFADVI